MTEIDRLKHDIDRQSRIIAEKDAEIERLTEEADKYCAWWREQRDRALAAESSRDAAVESEREACAEAADTAALSFQNLRDDPIVRSSEQAKETAAICAKASQEIAAAIRSRPQGG